MLEIISVYPHMRHFDMSSVHNVLQNLGPYLAFESV